MSPNDNIEMLPEAYPCDVRFSDQYSIFCIGLNHKVNDGSIKDGKSTICKDLEDEGWKPHPSIHNLEITKKFSIFTPQADSSIYGDTKWDDKLPLGQWLKKRLHSTEGERGSSEPVLLRRDVNQQFNTVGGPSESSIAFKVHWVDLWLFPDESAILSFKTQLESLESELNVSQISDFHRKIRDTALHPLRVVRSGAEGAKDELFWQDVVIQTFLKEGRCLGFSSIDECVSAFDPYQRNAKVLMAAQMKPTDEEEGLAWGRPLMDPPIRLQRKHEHLIETGEWDVALQAARSSIVAGYATVRDMVLFELATVSNEKGAAGWNGDKKFQYSLEYVRRMIEDNFVEVWEYWNALILRDTCTMVAFDPSMPLLTDNNHPEKLGQVETRYYPLYVYAYHQRYRLDRLSEELVDDNLSDVMKAQELRESFLRFRNRYWFHEVTTDFLGKEVFEKMKIGLGTERAHEMVQDEVDRIAGYVREKWQARTAILIAVWTAITGIAALPHGGLLVFSVFVFIGLLIGSLIMGFSPSKKLLDWVLIKAKSVYKKFLAMDLMRGA